MPWRQIPLRKVPAAIHARTAKVQTDELRGFLGPSLVILTLPLTITAFSPLNMVFLASLYEGSRLWG